jgi:hypothetical protein
LPKPDEGENAKRPITASGLRERAQLKKDMMVKAKKLVNAARKKGNNHAAAKHDREARENEAAMDVLNREAAKIIFEEKNKVCSGHRIEVPKPDPDARSTLFFFVVLGLYRGSD